MRDHARRWDSAAASRSRCASSSAGLRAHSISAAPSAANCLRDGGAEPKARAGDDRAPPGELHEIRPTEMSEKRLSDAERGAEESARDRSPRGLSWRPRPHPPRARGIPATRCRRTSASAPLAAERASAHRRTGFSSSGRLDTCGSNACTRAPSFNSARISSTDGERRKRAGAGLVGKAEDADRAAGERLQGAAELPVSPFAVMPVALDHPIDDRKRQAMLASRGREGIARRAPACRPQTRDRAGYRRRGRCADRNASPFSTSAASAPTCSQTRGELVRERHRQRQERVEPVLDHLGGLDRHPDQVVAELAEQRLEDRARALVARRRRRCGRDFGTPRSPGRAADFPASRRRRRCGRRPDARTPAPARRPSRPEAAPRRARPRRPSDAETAFLSAAARRRHRRGLPRRPACRGRPRRRRRPRRRQRRS